MVYLETRCGEIKKLSLQIKQDIRGLSYPGK